MNATFPILQTNRLLLRQFTQADLENVFTGLSHPDVIKYYGVNYTSPEAAKAQLQFFVELEQNETGIWWAVCSLDNTIFYGACGFNNLSKQHKKTEIGFWLLPKFWGQGIITEAVPVICNYAFTKLALHRIEAIVETENSNSKKIMDKLKFNHEGTMKECEIKNGAFISLYIYAKLSGKLL